MTSSVNGTLHRGGRGPDRTPSGTADRKRVVIIGSLGYSLVNFRLDLMRRFQANGYDVLALAAEIDPDTAAALDRNGIAHREIPMNRTGTNPFHDIRSLTALLRELRRARPDIVVAYTMKPIVYGCLAAQLASVPDRYALFTGLGYAFTEPNPTGRRRLVRTTTIWLHRMALRGITAAFCYNSADREDIRRFGLIPPKVALHDIPGSGVDTSRFAPTPVPAGPIKFLFVGRLLRSKGIAVLAEAAKKLKGEGLDFEIEILGPKDPNPDHISDRELEDWKAAGLIRHLGASDDVVPFIQNCSVFVLPTYLREGIPRSILEAMSCGRAVITTDSPGCGETIDDGVSGLVVPRGDAEALAGAMRRFVKEPGLAERFGQAARQKVCGTNDVHLVNAKLMHGMGIEIGGLEAVPQTGTLSAAVEPKTKREVSAP
ncbi:N,N'-diacetylbacillosaminyl-diphospho-undecaprenol alpha-1,3-N-acetylgalactosaminyltransferase [Roseivivax sp. THAF40]|uniref:glycosyltransferase family 4 protein n=1 Tax=unclassified Roseivivax TaxID=2639302 RepID=UPI0012AA2BD8|nr:MULTISPECIES: glycosyltransferase family 4 protein [unclassified Roseivivax]QFS82441.1 N,N'-diacetylbacillosaminyl-diphospho-undecaprenol alpha-1,3-N-acetylgalactosaminyltransferase [Roseivivax sp. THAF197b]QFT46210.1 N,N'-diacetylbacillosaminyl-diphospho-undecaprenol alpha-1,3-N-acetylgalactosaminyltransferase [Roseivivax sp. THAF40]